MKPGWIGSIVGVALGLGAVYFTDRAAQQSLPARYTPHKPTAAEASAALQACDPGGPSLATAYDKIAAPLHSYVTSDPAKALAAARGQVANMIDGKISSCARAVEMYGSLGSSIVPRVAPHLDHLHAARHTLDELIAALQSGSDAPQKLQALDAAIHAP